MLDWRVLSALLVHMPVARTICRSRGVGAEVGMQYAGALAATSSRIEEEEA